MRAFVLVVTFIFGLSTIVEPIQIGGNDKPAVAAPVIDLPKVVYVPLEPEPTTTTSSTTTTMPSTACAEWYSTALAVGWTAELWPRLAKIMFRESRCIPSAFNPDDPYGGSLGLVQINMFWCKAHRGNKQGYLQSASIITDCKNLLDPAINLRAALAIYNYAEQRHGGGWNPWST